MIVSEKVLYLTVRGQISELRCQWKAPRSVEIVGDTGTM